MTQSIRTGTRGSALVELTAVLPVLVTILVGASDFARAYYYSMELTAAARAGAQYGASTLTTSSDASGIRQTAANAATNVGLGANAVDIPDAGQYPVCASDDASSASFTYQASPATCSSTCSGGSAHMVCYVKVTARKEFRVISSYIPGVPSTITLNRTAYQAVQ
jgi:Flp pilus assembly protein TadG